MGETELTVEVPQHNKNIRKRQRQASLLVLPLLLFLIVFFISPIGFMLYRSFYNPKVAQLVPLTIEQLANWDNSKIPNEKTLKQFAYELKNLQKQHLSGKLAEEVNRRVSQVGSIIKRTARIIKTQDLSKINSFQQFFISIHPKWGETQIWSGIKMAGDAITINYFAHALDYSLQHDGTIIKKSSQVYLPILLRTLKIALIITLLTIVLAYPVSYYLANTSATKAGLLLILVLLPFLTSLLVRTTAWIAILQTNGIVNQILMGLQIINKPLDLIYNQFSTIIGMTHILLPFMILPLYSVMRRIDSTYVKAAQSLGANPFISFIKVYFPLTVPGLSAGSLLVFITAVGYYITPALLGGVQGQLISNLVAYHMRTTNNWELAAALGSVLLFTVIALYWVFNRIISFKNIKL